MDDPTARTRVVRPILGDEPWTELKILAYRRQQTLAELVATILLRFLAERPAT